MAALSSSFIFFIILLLIGLAKSSPIKKTDVSNLYISSSDYGIQYASSNGIKVSRLQQHRGRGGSNRGQRSTIRKGTRGNRGSNSNSSREKVERERERGYLRDAPPSGDSSNSDPPPPSPPVNGTSPNTPTPNSFNPLSALPLPSIKFRLNPLTTLKVRKIYTPLPKTVLTLGADYNTQLGVWQFRSDWEDKVIGGRLSLKGKELQLTKTWLLSVGAVEDLVTRLRLRASVDLQTGKAFARFGFRTERLNPINVVDGFTMKKRIPLDGRHAKLEVIANFAFPEPDFEIGSESRKHLVGMGDVEVGVEEINLLMEY